MLRKSIVRSCVKYLMVVAVVICFPWIFTLAFGQNNGQYIYETKSSGRYVQIEGSQIDVEDYVAMVLSGQMDIASEEEALKAQAVVIRTYIYEMMEECGKDTLSAEDTGFSYYTYKELEDIWGEQFEENYNKLMKVVSNTSMEVITYDKKLIKPYFHLASSGNTRDGAQVIGEEVPYLKSVQSSKDVESERYLQGVIIDKKDFVETLRKAKSDICISDESPLETLQIVSRCEAGYISSLQIGNVTMTGDEFVYIFNLASPNFQVDEYDGSVRVVTKGCGHGLGLSMYGAIKLAETGKSYKEILCHYYTDVSILNKPEK